MLSAQKVKVKLHMIAKKFQSINYSHLSNKRDVTLTDFEKFHPTQIKNPPYTFIDFLDFSTLHSTFIRFMY